MNLLKLGKKRSNYLYLLVLSFLYLLFVFLNRQAFFQKFDPEVVNRYLRSQDIEDRQNLIKDRIFISDSDIYIASGYLYANGTKPTDYNFQHPPFIKYLFGLSAKYFNLPLLPNMIFAAVLIFEVCLLGKLIYKSEFIGTLSSIMLMFDPVYKEVATYALLDIGQIVFVLGFLIITIFYSKHFMLEGLFLGLALASKFYSPIIIFLSLVYLYKVVNKNFNLKRELIVMLIAVAIFCFTYLLVYPFNIFFHQAKLVKFMLDHNRSVEWGGVLKIFFGGYFIWPVLFFLNMFNFINSKMFSFQSLFLLIPIFYLVIFTFQIPFTRYFIFILPFLYISFGKALTKLISMV